MVINADTPSGTVLANQTVATGNTLLASTNSDNIDATNTSIFGPGDQPPSDSILQPQNPASIDPTIAIIQAPTAAAASVDGSVRTPSGLGIAGAVITATNAETGVSVMARTNSLGRYRITNLEAGQVYQISVSHKTHIFADNSVTFTLNDSVTGLAFIGTPPQTRSEMLPSPASVKLRR
jgi:hypothetical protein